MNPFCWHATVVCLAPPGVAGLKGAACYVVRGEKSVRTLEAEDSDKLKERLLQARHDILEVARWRVYSYPEPSATLLNLCDNKNLKLYN